MNFDCVSPEFWGPGMHERLGRLRREAPVYWDEQNELWVLSRYDDVAAVSKNPAAFCSGHGTRPVPTPPLSIIDMDGDRHRQLRSLVNKGFTPRRVGMLEDRFRGQVRDVLGKVASGCVFDFVKEVAAPLPLFMIAEMIGIEPDRFEDFRRWSDGMMAAASGDDDPAAYTAGVTAAAEYAGYLANVIEERRAQPKDDLISILIGASDDGTLVDGTLSRSYRDPGDEEIAGNELTMFLVLLMVAGNETTRNALTGGVSALLENPGELEKLARDPSGIPVAVEEIVRFVSPVLNFVRTATCDTEIRGQRVRKGERVLLLYPSANRDQDVFHAPDRFIVDRQPNAHLGFGLGPHFCLGANLARMEIAVVLEELITIFDELELREGPARPTPHGLVRNFERLILSGRAR